MLICSRCPVLVRSFRGCGVNILSSNPTLIRFNENSQHVSHLTVELVFVVVAVARWCCCCSVVVLLSAGGGASCGASPWNWFGHIQWAWSTYTHTHTQPLSCVCVCVFLISSVDTVKSGFFFFHWSLVWHKYQSFPSHWPTGRTKTHSVRVCICATSLNPLLKHKH